MNEGLDMSEVPETMQAVVVTAPNEFSLKEVPTPLPTGDEVLCRVRAVAICGTDPKILRGSYPGMWPPSYPFIIGHEWSGNVVALSPEVASSTSIAARFKPGTRVAGESHRGCGICENCLSGRYTLCLNYGDASTGHRQYGFTAQGAYAEYIAVSVRTLTLLPEVASHRDGAMLDAAGVAVHSVRRGGVGLGDTVVVLGDGPVGNLAFQYARAAGAEQVAVVGTGPRLKLAMKMGAVGIDFRAANVLAEITALTSGVGADCVIEASGATLACEWAVAMARKGGRVVLGGLPTEPVQLRWDQVALAELDLRGVRANPNSVTPALALIARGIIDTRSLQTHCYPLARFAEAVDAATSPDSGAMKVIVEP